MTNQQGAPEAPKSTALDGKTELFHVSGYPLLVRAVDFNRLYAEKGRLAALVDAQQPAPSTAVALSDDLRDRLAAISEAVADQDDRAAQAMLREILKAPHPSPAPQADSQPALPEITAEDRSFLHYNPNTDDVVDWVHHYASAAIASDRAARAPADSVLEDAARYRWIAAHCRSTSEHWGGRWSIIIDGPAPKSHDGEDDFDEAVDAARKQGANHD